MSETILIDTTLSKTEKYAALLPQLRSLTENETDVIANMANISAALKEVFGWWWVGFYLVKNDELILGPFQGPIACTRIKYGRGVCGTAWKEKQTLLVPDVEQFPGHIACSSASKTEIVVPVFNAENNVVGVLDVDSERLGILDEADKEGLEEVVKLLTHSL